MKKNHRLKIAKTVSSRKKNKSVFRTCIVCRARREQEELHRFTWLDGRAIEDGMKKKQSRGAYCCKSDVCYSEFLKKEKRLHRAFRL